VGSVVLADGVARIVQHMLQKGQGPQVVKGYNGNEEG
jgi:hypothetical protein